MVDLKAPVKQKPETHSVSLAVDATGKMDDKSQEFEAVVFGDSDFLSNHSLMVGVNRDLGLNSFAKLANEKDLLSIRPKMPKGTMIILTGFAKLCIVVAALTLPVFLLATAGVVWFRRRGA